MSKRIAAVFGLTMLFLFWCDKASAQASLWELKACREIGNIIGEGRVTCVDEGGNKRGKAGEPTFVNGDKIFILVRLKGLPLGPHRLRVSYQKEGPGGHFGPLEHTERRFNGNHVNTATWFETRHKETGRWRVHVMLLTANGIQLRRTTLYCVNCIGE
jgi:hypothetical protein